MAELTVVEWAAIQTAGASLMYGLKVAVVKDKAMQGRLLAELAAEIRVPEAMPVEQLRIPSS